MFLSLDGNLNLKCVAVGPINSFVALSVASLLAAASNVINGVVGNVRNNGNYVQRQIEWQSQPSFNCYQDLGGSVPNSSQSERSWRDLWRILQEWQHEGSESWKILKESHNSLENACRAIKDPAGTWEIPKSTQKILHSRKIPIKSWKGSQ